MTLAAKVVLSAFLIGIFAAGIGRPAVVVAGLGSRGAVLVDRTPADALLGTGLLLLALLALWPRDDK